MKWNALIWITLIIGTAIWTSGCNSDPGIIAYEVAYQESATLDRYLSLIFYDVAEDSRCPVDVNCVHPGRVEIVLTPLYYDALGTPIHVALDPDTPALASAVVSDEYQVELLAVDPLPPSSGGIELDDYTIRIAVERK